MFFGLQERQLDDKGRVALPARWRAGFGDRCFLTPGQNRCINVLTADDFEAAAADLKQRVDNGELPLSRLRTLLSNAEEVQIDGQGRVKLEAHLRHYARIAPNTKVVVTGLMDRLEIWSEMVHADEQARGDLELAGAGQ